jgi:hypothetical protein
VLRLRPSRALGRSGFECSRDRLELQQRALEIVHDLAGDDLRGHTVVGVGKARVLQPGDVEVRLVPRGQLVVAEQRPPLALLALLSIGTGQYTSRNGARCSSRRGRCLRGKCSAVR